MRDKDKELFSILNRGGAASAGHPPEIIRLAEALAAIHGDVEIASESSGIHLYFADPGLLAQDGSKEFRSKHCAVNASKYFGFGKWGNASQKERRRCAVCMKDGRTYTVDRLLSYMPLRHRGDVAASAGVVRDKVREHVTVVDEHGVEVPDGPGQTIPLTQLPADHPAVVYLRNRGYDLQLLERMFEACYCAAEAPPVRGKRGYRTLVDGWRNTPQGRIIFGARVRGSRVIWQGRVIEHADDTRHYVWHPYRLQWCVDAVRDTPGDPWKFVAPYDQVDEHGAFIWKDLAKYFTTPGGHRNKAVLGFDSAVAWNANRPPAKRFAVLMEGPLDAGKPGPPCVAAIGKFISPGQAELLASEFPTVFVGYDNDTAGREQRLKGAKTLMDAGCRIRHLIAPEDKKDWGEMTPVACWQRILRLSASL